MDLSHDVVGLFLSTDPTSTPRLPNSTFDTKVYQVNTLYPSLSEPVSQSLTFDSHRSLSKRSVERPLLSLVLLDMGRIPTTLWQGFIPLTGPCAALLVWAIAFINLGAAGFGIGASFVLCFLTDPLRLPVGAFLHRDWR